MRINVRSALVSISVGAACFCLGCNNSETENTPTATRPPSRDRTIPTLVIPRLDSIINRDTLTITGTARDSGKVAQITAEWAIPCCRGPILDVPIVPDTVVHFSATHVLSDDLTYVIRITAIDSSGNRITQTLQTTTDLQPPRMYMIAPVTSTGDRGLINVEGIELFSTTLALTISVNGGQDQVLAQLAGTPSPDPLTPKPKLYFDQFQTPAGGDTTSFVLSLRDPAGNVATKSWRVRRAPPIVEIANGLSHWCILENTGRTWCWVDNSLGQLGAAATSYTVTPVPVDGGLRFQHIAAGYYHTCGLDAGGAVYCWGVTQWDTTPNPPKPSAYTSVPVPVAPGLSFQALAAGWGHTCGLTAAGAAYCWGLNIAGELGDSTTITRTTPAPVSGGHVFTAITAANIHTCGLTADGEAFCWGDNNAGKLGTEASLPLSQTTPVPAAISLRFRTLMAGSEQTCGVATDGYAYCWGLGDDGRLGVGACCAVLIPAIVLTPEPVTTISVFDTFGCELGVSGTTYCQGNVRSGQLGSFLHSAFSNFIAYPSEGAYGLPLTQIQTGILGACALSTDADLYCWGTLDFDGNPIVVP